MDLEPVRCHTCATVGPTAGPHHLTSCSMYRYEAPAWDGIWMHAEVLARLPPWMVVDFDCLRGPHEWLGMVTTGTEYRFCKHCDRRKKIPCPDDTRDPLAVIYDLQFSRR